MQQASAAPPTCLRAAGLCKRYGQRAAVQDLHLACEAGQVLGLLGANGAGKTTTLRMLYGLVQPDAGSIHYGELDFAHQRREAKRLIGVCTQDDSLDHDLSVEANLRVYATYFRPRPQQIPARVEALLQLFKLESYRQASPRTLSGGFRQRLLVARSLVHSPEWLFLDEPTTGLDPEARVQLWQLIRQLRDEGLGIILTTHYMDEAEKLSDRIVLMSQGKAVAHGSCDAVVGQLIGQHIVTVLQTEPRLAELKAWLAAHAQSYDGTKTGGRSVLGEWHFPLTTARLQAFLVHFPDMRHQLRPPTLEDLFLHVAD